MITIERTYKIVRFKFNDDNEVIKESLTLEEAQEWCNREDTHDVDTENGWFDGYSVEPLDTDAVYKVESYSGIAWRIIGFATETIATEFDDEGEIYIEQEEIEREDRVTCVMIGDDREFEFDIDELSVLDDDEYCSVCGQIGCNHNY